MSKDAEDYSRVGKEILGDDEGSVQGPDDLGDAEPEDVEDTDAAQETEAAPEVLDNIPLSMREDLSPEEAERLYEEKIARLTQVLSRGVLNDALQRIIDQAVPEGYHGKFVRDNEGDINRYRNLGYGFTYREGTQVRGSHGTGDSRIRQGDVVLMTVSGEQMDLLKEVRRRLVRKKLEIGKEEYLARAASEEAAPAFDESKLTIG